MKKNKKKILIVSRDGNDILSQSSNVNKIINGLNNLGLYEIEVLTWPYKFDTWTGQQPQENFLDYPNVKYLKKKYGNINYHIFSFPNFYHKTILNDKKLNFLEKLSKKIFQILKPDLVLLQHRMGLWWIIRAAQINGIKTIYLNHDFGLICYRSSLLKNNDRLCNGIFGVKKCSECFLSNKNQLFKIHDSLNKNLYYNKLFKFLYQKIDTRDLINSNIDLDNSSSSIFEGHFSYTKKILSNLDVLITPSYFGKKFFSKYVSEKQIKIIPWFYEYKVSKRIKNPNEIRNVTYLGRISYDKGIDILLNSIKLLKNKFIFNVVGFKDDQFSNKIRVDFKKISDHKINLFDWSVNIDKFLFSADILVIPSRVMDNTPISAIQFLANKIPIIVPDIPTFNTPSFDGFNSIYKFKRNSPKSLARSIDKLNDDMNANKKLIFPNLLNLNEYSKEISNIINGVI